MVSLILKNASLYDPYWSILPPVLFIFTLIQFPEYFSIASLLMVVVISLWSIRLTYNWAKLWTGFDEMDWRYVNFKENHPKSYILINLFGIQLMPTLIVFAQVYVGISFMMHQDSLNLIIILGSLIILSSTCIQYIADSQMQAFKKRNKGKKMLIDEGLWRYSRHPNYFGEIMVWWGLYIMYFGAVKQLDLLVIAPIIMTLLFNYISIPLMENKILSTRPSYEAYQQKVSKLLFLPRKETQEEPLKN
jgi:steroid 5-alpha reductase family enzyme